MATVWDIGRRRDFYVEQFAAMRYSLDKRYCAMEKVINEIRVIETDDGFRIEIKGDKEAIRRMLSGFGLNSVFGAKGPFGRGFRFGDPSSRSSPQSVLLFFMPLDKAKVL